MPRLQERAKCLVSQLLDEREQRKSKETASEELTLALSEEDTLPDPARPVMVTKKAVPARNRKRFDVHQDKSRSKRVRRVPAKLLDWTICYHFGSFLYHCDFFMKYYTLCLWRLVPVFKCDSKLMDYLDCLMRDKQKESSGSKVVQLVGLIFLLSFLDLGVSHLFIAANPVSSARRQIRAETELRPASKWQTNV